MFKKIFILIAVMAMAFNFVGCSSNTSYSEMESKTENQIEESSMFVVVEESNKWSIVYHKSTKIMYVVPHTELLLDGSYKYGTFTVMLDSEGKPLRYEDVEDLRLEKK